MAMYVKKHDGTLHLHKDGAIATTAGSTVLILSGADKGSSIIATYPAADVSTTGLYTEYVDHDAAPAEVPTE